jgi:hypothetical protein
MQLSTQLFAGALLVVLMTVVHGLGVVGVTRLLRLEDHALRAHKLDGRAFGLLTTMAICLFTLHALEIWMFAAFYLAVGALHSLEEALYFSTSAYATLGHPDLAFPTDWRLIGAFEGLVGFLFIGWSTAVFVTDMNKLLRK